MNESCITRCELKGTKLKQGPPRWSYMWNQSNKFRNIYNTLIDPVQSEYQKSVVCLTVIDIQ